MPLLLLVLAALIQVRGQPLDGGRLSGSVEVPLERAEAGDTPVLSLLSSRGRLRLLLDTGASSTMVTPELVQRLGLRSQQVAPDAFELAGGGQGCRGLRPRRSRLPDLELVSPPGAGRLRMSGIDALVLPAAALPQGVDGVLGAPTLRRHPIWIDPQRHRLAFGAAALRLAAQADAWSGAPERLRLRWQQGVPLLGLRTPIGLVPALADTGAEGLFVSAGLAERLPLQGSRHPLRLVGFCGEQPAEQTAVNGLGLSGLPVGELPDRPRSSQEPHAVIITANPIFRVLGVEAIVGQELLRQRRQLWRLDLEPPRLELR